MRNSHDPERAVFNPRLFLALTLCCFAGLLAVVAFASTPSSGTLTDTSGPLTYSAGPFTQANPSPLGLGQLDTGPRCGTGFPCDSYLLNVTMPSSITGFPDAAIKVTMSWKDAGSGQSDYDLYIFKGNVDTTSGSMRPFTKAATGANPEIATIFPVTAGTQQYTIKIVPYTPTGETLSVRIEFFQGAAGAPTPTPPPGATPPPAFGSADPTIPGNPRYMNFYAPVGSAAEASSGEFNIGFNPKTGRIMAMNAGPVFRITPPEKLGKPECCEGLWEDRSFATTTTGTDPILITEPVSGRTIAVNNLSSPELMYAYTDNDGDTWNPVGGGPPNGADHETVGAGPLPASLSPLITPLNKGQLVIFCSQDLVGANCERSLDLGMTYGPAIVATGPGATNSQGCGGLHGHVRIAPDGTAYLPDKSCGSIGTAPNTIPVQGGALSLDGSITPWTEFRVQKTVADADGPAFVAVSQKNGADPSIALDKANTIYYCYVNNESNGTEGHVHCAVGKRSTDPLTPSKINWIRDTDVGLAKGIVNAAHPEAIAGDAGRAACGFFGTDVKGDYQAGLFPGVWYTFIATTYDEGRTWVTVNATPDDPIQRMTGIWQQGGSGDMGDRNLLDFNEVTMDDKGRPLYGYSDGCTTPQCIAGTAKSNLGAAMRVARQTGGRTLLAAYDSMTDTVAPIPPKAPCLRGTRDNTGSRLTWTPPDNGGADISAYNIFRSTSSGTEVQIATYVVDATSKPAYTDTTADPKVADYFYTIQAVNSAGVGLFSNEVDLKVVQIPVVVENVCQIPGLTILTDSAADSVGAPGTDLLAFRLAQPTYQDGIQRLVFTLNVDPSQGIQPDGSFYYVSMKLVNGATTTYKGVRMVFNPTPTFESYTPSGNSAGNVDGRFVTAGSSKPADPSSSYDPATGRITIVVKLSDLGLAAGSPIGGFVSGVAQPANPTGTGPNAVTLYDQMPNSLAYTGAYTVGNANACSSLVKADSRKTHGDAGSFDIAMPLTGTPGIEPRSGGIKGVHSLVLSFDRNILPTPTAAAKVSPSGAGEVVAGPDANQLTVNLAAIPNAQHMTVALGGIQDTTGAPLGNISVPMDVLLADTNGDGTVNSGDAQQTRNASGQSTVGTNFRTDVNADGVINSADATVVRNNSGNALPAAPMLNDTRAISRAQ